MGSIWCCLCWIVWQHEKWGHWCCVYYSLLQFGEGSGWILFERWMPQCRSKGCSFTECQLHLLDEWYQLQHHNKRQKPLPITLNVSLPLVALSAFLRRNQHAAWYIQADIWNRVITNWKCAYYRFASGLDSTMVGLIVDTGAVTAMVY